MLHVYTQPEAMDRTEGQKFVRKLSVMNPAKFVVMFVEMEQAHQRDRARWMAEAAAARADESKRVDESEQIVRQRAEQFLQRVRAIWSVPPTQYQLSHDDHNA